MKKSHINGKSIIGNNEVDCNILIDVDKSYIHKTNTSFWDSEGGEVLGNTSLPFYGAFVSEEKCQLFGEVSGKKVLEIGCGTGHSLQYLAERKVSELWGLDISEKQIQKAGQHLAAKGFSAKFVCSPMEVECGIPVDYFDFVYSVYAIGWTTDLDAVFSRIASYLKKDGIFIFSWSHPIHKCVAVENDRFIFKKSYFDESWYSVSLGEGTLTLSDRKLSTYVNALGKAGFVIEQIIEESDDEFMKDNDSNFVKKGRMFPVTFVIKARKL